MKTLYLLRHAHAAPRELSLSDFDRPLEESGREEAEAVANYLLGKAIIFDFIMCSAALRTQETLEPLRKMSDDNAIEISIDFYNISVEQILNHLKKISDKRNTVLYIGHNPGIAFTVLKLARVLPDVLMEGITPATLIGFQLPIDKWQNLEGGEGETIDVFQPSLPSRESSLSKVP